MRLVFPARVYCAEPGCAQYFEREVEGEVSPVTTGRTITLHIPDVGPVPKGWYVRYHMVLCPRHNPDVEHEEPEEVPDRDDAPLDVVEKARRLQALAMDRAAAPGERTNAWAQFQKLWEQYSLPNDLGFEREENV